METSTSGVTTPLGAVGTDRYLTALANEFQRALVTPNIHRARTLVSEAAGAGLDPGALYIRVVRPVLARLQAGGNRHHMRLAVGIGENILVDLLARLHPVRRHAPGRAAVLSCRELGVDALDGRVVIGFLEADGWKVTELREEADVAGPFRDAFPELAVVVVGGPEDALRLAAACTALRRLPDPPVILVCEFTETGRSRAQIMLSLGADALAADPDELLRCIGERLPSDGRRRWGVRIGRSGGSLTVAPTGRLDTVGVERLLAIVGSRAGTFSDLVIDFRDLAEVDAAGASSLRAWIDGLALGSASLRLLTDARLSEQLDLPAA